MSASARSIDTTAATAYEEHLVTKVFGPWAEKVVDLAAPVSRVWRALTDHEEFGQWFRVRLDGPFQVGVTTTGNITAPGYEHVQWESLTEAMEHERLFVFSWPPGPASVPTRPTCGSASPPRRRRSSAGASRSWPQCWAADFGVKSLLCTEQMGTFHFSHQFL